MKQFIQQTNDFNNNNLSSSPQSNSWLLSNYGTSSNATNTTTTTTTTAINNTTTKQQQSNNNNTLKQQLQQVTSLDLNADINSTKNNNSTTTTATSGLDSTKFFGKHLFDGYLELQDGTRFYGKSFGATKSNRPIVVNNTTFTTTDNTLDNSVDNNDDNSSDNDDNIWDTPYSVSGECVFTTAQVGYPESLTDPSYSGQILILTFPLIGNYGVPHFKKNQLPSTATMNNTTLLNTNIEIINNKNNNNQIIEWDDDLLPKLESNKIHIRGLIIQDYSNNYSHYEAICSLHRWLQEYNIPGLYNIDTRLLTKKLRNGTMLGRMIMDIKMFDQFNTSLQFNTLQQNNGINKWYDPGMDKNIIKKVSCKEIKIYGLGNFYKVIAIDCGIKYNIIRELIKRNIELKVVPYNYNWLNDIYNCNTNNNSNYGSDNDNSKNRIDGIFISNGPGNPNHFEITIQYLKQYINDCLLQQSQLQQQSQSTLQQIPIIPIFGICLGNQLIAKAIGAKVYKLPFGNRGHNQPVIDQLTRRGFITSQNHGYAVDNQSLLEMSTSTTEITKYFKPYFLNANDASNEGIYCLNLPLFTCQFHPEAKGGPNDTLFLFDQFIDFMKLKKSGKLFKIYISSLLGNTNNNKNDNNNFEPYYSRIYLKQHKSMRKKFNELLSSIEDTSDISTPILQQQSTLMKKSIFYNDNTDIDNNNHNNKQKELKGYSGRQIKLPKKVILLGSGGLQIGQAGEFDYSGSQAIKALKEEGIFTILINPNIATVQTCKDLADRVYFGPITPSYVEKVIIKEKADGLLLSFGGQTALNCGVNLYKSGILDKYGCKVLGTPVQSIIDTEDRDIFNRKMREINQPVAESVACDNVEEAITSANQLLGYPVIVRAAFALGGLGSGFANNDKELRELATQALSTSPQILVEKSVKGWKEIEYEVVRDSNDNCITVCNMENFDPVGIHTGESIVVAPSQTLNNDEYHMLRTAAIKVIRHLGIVGECNIQYALNPYNSNEYVIIEVNARLSRSSALASKATGYPLAFVAAKLALGMELIDIKNSVTKETCACFEPALDYCVVKIPRWDLKKFLRVSSELGSAMKSVGEVMAIGRNFEEAIQKALRMVDGSIRGFETTNSLFDYDKWLRSNNSNVGHGHSGHNHGHSHGHSGHGHNLGHMNTNTLSTLPTVLHNNNNNAKEELKQSIIKELTRPTDQRVFAIALAMEYFDMTVDQIHSYTQIDRWFLHKLNNIIQTRKHFKIIGKKVNHLLDIPYSLILCAKQQGFTDLQIASYISLDAFESYSEIINFYNENHVINHEKNNVINHEKNHVINYIEKFRYTLSTTNYKQFTNIDKELLIRYIRKYIHKIEPIVKQIDTLAAEYPAQTNYLYMTYNAGINSIALPITNKENDKEVKFIYPDHHLHHDIEFNKEKGIIVLGSGVYRIGSSVEFDYCGVMCVRELRNKLGYKNVIMINYNPETVSTDFDEPNRLYFEELNFERVMDIYEIENQQYFNTCDSNSCDNSCDSDNNNNGIMGMIVSVGGQQPNNIALSLEKQGNAKLLGSGADAIDMCENRFKFSNLLDSLNHNHHCNNNSNNTTNTTTTSTKLGKFKKNKLIYQPEWAALTTIEDALKFSNQPTIGYPVLIRPSYVLSGAAMNVAYSDNELLNYLYQAVDVSQEHPVVISKFYENAKEIEIDGVAMNGTIIVDAISEHVERAGTHSGDATLICPPYSLSFDLQDLVREKAALIVNALKISGPFNMQFLFDNEQSQSKNRNNYSPNFNGSSSDDDEDEENDDFELSPLRSVDSVGSELSSLDEDEDYNSDYEYGSNNYYGKKERIKLYRNLSKRLKVIECNLRASRSFPFISKTLNVDFISLATRIMTGHFKLPNMELNNINDKDGPTSNYFEQMKLLKEISKLRLESNDTSFNESLKDGDYKKFTKELTEYEMIQKRRFSKSFYGCKTSMFSFRRLADSDPKLGVEMASTGEVACFGQTVRDAFLKAMQSAYSNQLPTNPLTVNERSKNILIASFPHSTKSNMELINQILQSIYILYEYLQYTIYVTPYVAEKLSQQLPSVKFHTLQLQQIVPVDKNGICKSSLLKLDEESDILRKIAEDINFVVDVPFPDHNQKLLQQHYLIRRKTINYDKHLFFTYEVFNLYVRCLKDLKDKKMNLDNLNVHPYSHYLRLQSKDLNC
ncbi:hypothetical protein ABK040_002712 [Willaertia magna]